MNVLKFITLILLFGLTSVAIACGETQEGKRTKLIYPVVGMSYSEFSKVLIVVEKTIGNEKIINISLHFSGETLYVCAKSLLMSLKTCQSGKGFVL